jgi:peptidoglycan L-alanyl-D-glutamate endopeptidase CwlK
VPAFSARSLGHLNSCHPDLVRLFTEVIKHYDCTVIEGQRSEERQRELVRTGKSHTMFSRHLQSPSMAADVVPYPVEWNRRGRERMRHFAGFVFGVASQLGIERLRWGGDWDGDVWTKRDGLRDQSFMDLPHFGLLDA